MLGPAQDEAYFHSLFFSFSATTTTTTNPLVPDLPLSAEDFCFGVEPTTTVSASNPYWLACRLTFKDCLLSAGGLDPSNQCCLSVVSTVSPFCGGTVGTFIGDCLNYIVELYTTTLSCGDIGNTNLHTSWY